MSKKKSIFVVFSALVFALASAWVLLRPKETDVYFAALSPYSNFSSVLTSKPSTCDVTAKSVPAIPSELLASFLDANNSSAKPISLKVLRSKFAVADGTKLKNAALAGVSPQTLISGPRTLVYLSRVGYSSNGSDALFCVQGLGSGLFHLRYQNGHWQQVQMITVGLI
jgi:hypothetical protein